MKHVRTYISYFYLDISIGNHIHRVVTTFRVSITMTFDREYNRQYKLKHKEEILANKNILSTKSGIDERKSKII